MTAPETSPENLASISPGDIDRTTPANPTDADTFTSAVDEQIIRFLTPNEIASLKEYLTRTLNESSEEAGATVDHANMIVISNYISDGPVYAV